MCCIPSSLKSLQLGFNCGRKTQRSKILS
ncbi:MAG: hypothetical protein JW815_03450 [Candidatus Bathyarchaeota archaeon]|nr:hypothetical protein [Candidatus Bathyarchaeum sp.]